MGEIESIFNQKEPKLVHILSTKYLENRKFTPLLTEWILMEFSQATLFYINPHCWH